MKLRASQRETLEKFRRYPDGLDAPELADDLGLSIISAESRLHRLEQRGFVRQCRLLWVGQRSIFLYCLTDKGRKVLGE